MDRHGTKGFCVLLLAERAGDEGFHLAGAAVGVARQPGARGAFLRRLDFEARARAVALALAHALGGALAVWRAVASRLAVLAGLDDPGIRQLGYRVGRSARRLG